MMRNKTWNSLDKYFEDRVNTLLTKSIEYKRDYFASKYQWLKENHPEYWGNTLEWGYAFGIEFLDQLKIHNYKSILDVGCGSGAFCRLVKDQNVCDDVWGMDIVDNVLVSRDGITFDLGYSAHELPYEDNQFDAVTIFDVMEHIIEEDVSLVLDELFRVASKQVFLVICYRKSFSFRDEIGELHATVRDRVWWEHQLLKYCTKNYYQNQFQSDTVFWSIEI